MAFCTNCGSKIDDEALLPRLRRTRCARSA